MEEIAPDQIETPDEVNIYLMIRRDSLEIWVMENLELVATYGILYMWIVFPTLALWNQSFPITNTQF